MIVFLITWAVLVGSYLFLFWWLADMLGISKQAIKRADKQRLLDRAASGNAGPLRYNRRTGEVDHGDSS